MKYVVQTLVEAKNAEEAIKLAKRTAPKEVYLEEEVIKEPKVGF